MTTHIGVQETTFYEQLQNCSALDLRCNQGKQHDLAFILLGLTLGLLRKRDGNLSSIHRSMENTVEDLCAFLGIGLRKVISRSHFPKVLQKVNLGVFEQLLFDNFGVRLTPCQKQWFAADGKELRGSISGGAKRGTAIVQLVEHEQRDVLGEAFYNGQKESEKPCLQALITKSGAANQKITADALHLNPNTTQPINQAEGIFLIGLKENQPLLLKSMKTYAQDHPPLKEAVTNDKGHGRVEKRMYAQFDIEQQVFDKRWDKTEFKSLFRVERWRFISATNEESISTDYYISNGSAHDSENYFKAIRNHWAVETNNHIRDVTLQEDKLKTTCTAVTKTLAGCRTLVVQLLNKLKPKNRVAQLERFADKFTELLTWLRKINFL